MERNELKKIIDDHAAWLSSGDGERADLHGANLSGADLHGADLHGANLSWADLHGENLRGADLSWADLRGADLSWANLSHADLRGADLHEADLSGANLHGATVPFSNSYMDIRNYTIHYRADENDILFIAGCHKFSIDEARNHWGSSDYPSPARGRRMLATCEMLYCWWLDGILPGVKKGGKG